MSKQYGIMPCCGAPLVNPVQHLSFCKQSRLNGMTVEQIMNNLMEFIVEDTENMSEKEMEELCDDLKQDGVDIDKMVDDVKLMVKKILDEFDKKDKSSCELPMK